MALSTLANTKWLINSFLNWAPFSSSSSDYDYTNITFTSNNQTYNELYFEKRSNNTIGLIEYEIDQVYYTIDQIHYATWENKAYRIINFIQGTDLVDSELISWFEANAIQITHDVEISYKNSIITSTNSSGTITLDTAGTYCEDDIEVVYTKPGGGINLQSKTATPSGATQTITADSGYDGLDTVTVNPIVLKSGILLPAAELIQTYSYNKLFVTEESGTIPSYTTTATSMLAGQTLSQTVQLDLINYDYELLIRGLAIPIYNTNTKEKGRTVYTTFAGGFEIVNTPANMFYDGSKYYNKNVASAHGLASTIRNCYWSSATAVAVANGGYGPYFTQVAPTFSSATVTNPTLTIKSPAFYIRGSTSVFTSSAWSKMTDIRFQYKIELYRIAKSTYNLDGWGFEQQTYKIVDDYYNNNATLT